MSVAVLATVAAVSTVAVQPSVSVPLQPAKGEHASGIVRFTPRGNGTHADVSLRHLRPGPTFAVLQSGTCAHPSESYADLPPLRRRPDGTARADGPVLFNGLISVGILAIADGDHVVRVVSNGRVEACGAVPKLRPT